MTISGAMRTYPIITNRLLKTAHPLSFGPGIFGWTAIQAHAKSVEKQLQIMLHIVRVSEGVSSLIGIDCELETAGGSGGRPIGMASVDVLKLIERQSKVRRIMGAISYGTSRQPYYKWIESAMFDNSADSWARQGQTSILGVTGK